MQADEILRAYVASLILEGCIDHVEIKSGAGFGVCLGRVLGEELIFVHRHVSSFELEDEENVQKVILSQIESAMEELDQAVIHHAGHMGMLPWGAGSADTEQVH
jgi:hypothetical protein